MGKSTSYYYGKITVIVVKNLSLSFYNYGKLWFYSYINQETKYGVFFRVNPIH